jgi:DNA repair exonuclease SbcCD nuclease subunit
VSLVRFVHAADLHLDSPFKGIHAVSPAVGAVLREATFAAFERIVELCIEEDVDALLVAGDVYDGADRSLRAQLRFIAGLERLDEAGIRSFICHGNHDPLDGWTARLRLPPGCHQFGTEVEAVPLDDLGLAAVYGVSYGQAAVTGDLAATFDATADRRFSIGLLHCTAGAAGGHENYAPAGLDTLVGAGIDYWALGHVHTRQILRERRPAVVYPGNPQGLQPNETGPRGVYLVEVDERGVAGFQFRAVDAVRWAQPRIDIGGLESEQALLDLCRARVQQMIEEAGGRPLVYRLAFEGGGELHEALSDAHLLADLAAGLNDEYGRSAPFAWCDGAASETRPAFDRALRREAGDFLATVLELSENLQHDPQGRETLREDLAALLQHERFAPYRRECGLRDDDLAGVIAEAETRVVEALRAPL